MFLISCIFWLTAIICGVQTLPRISGIMCLLGAVVLFPMEKWQSWLAEKTHWTRARRNALFAVLLFGGMAIESVGPDAYVVVAMAGVVVLFLILLRALNPEGAAAADERRAEKAARKTAEKEAEKEYRREFEARWAEEHKPIKAVLIGTSDTTKTTKSGVATAGRAIVGGALLGPVGAVAGAVSGKSQTKVVKQTATFSVKYANGKTGTETVRIGSKRFKELSALLVD